MEFNDLLKIKRKAASSWFKHYKTSGNWGKGASYAPETKPHVLKSNLLD